MSRMEIAANQFSKPDLGRSQYRTLIVFNKSRVKMEIQYTNIIQIITIKQNNYSYAKYCVKCDINFKKIV